MTRSKLAVHASSATPSAGNAAGTPGKTADPSAWTVEEICREHASRGWRSNGFSVDCHRITCFTAMGVNWELKCIVEAGSCGTFAHVSVGVAPEGPALVIRRSRTLQLTKLIKLLDRITANVRRIGFQGDWRFPSMMGDRVWPAVQFRKQLKDAKGVRREFERLSALTSRDLLA